MKSEEKVEWQAKKAARRAAFVQDIAEAVYSLGVQRQNEAWTKQQLVESAQKATQLAVQLAKHAAYDAEHPIEAAMYRENPYWRESLILARRKLALVLNWATAKGILPIGTTQLPDKYAQYLALARSGLVNI